MLALALVALAPSCGDDARARCPECGMYVDLGPRWNAGLGDLVFDTPKCMLRRRAQAGGGAAWVIEYYSQQRAALDAVRLVEGSDVVGPMGRDLVPVAPAHVARFVADHGGRALPPGAPDPSILSELR